MIRKACESDIAAIQKISRQHPSELGRIYADKLFEAIQRDTLYVSERDAQLVGFVQWNRPKKGINIGASVVYHIGVHKDYLRQGIGEQLLNVVPSPILLKVTSDNISARFFYLRYGFKRKGTEFAKSGRRLCCYIYDVRPAFAVVRGGSKSAIECCVETGVPYGVREDYKSYAPNIFMIDFDWTKPVTAQRWQRYLQKIRDLKPMKAMVPDYESPAQKEALLQYIEDVRKTGVSEVMVCPKFEGAVKDIPDWCTVAISVPTRDKETQKYAGWLPQPEEVIGRRLHLLGGHPDQWAALENIVYVRSRVASIDGNNMFRKAGLAQYWKPEGGYADLRNQGFDDKALVMASLRNIPAYLDGRPRNFKSSRVSEMIANLTLREGTHIQMPLFGGEL